MAPDPLVMPVPFIIPPFPSRGGGGIIAPDPFVMPLPSRGGGGMRSSAEADARTESPAKVAIDAIASDRESTRYCIGKREE
jgi:hypothetical protein